MQRCKLIIILWCMLENMHEAKLLQPMASRDTEIKAAWAPRTAQAAQRCWHASQNRPFLCCWRNFAKTFEWRAQLTCNY